MWNNHKVTGTNNRDNGVEALWYRQPWNVTYCSGNGSFEVVQASAMHQAVEHVAAATAGCGTRSTIGLVIRTGPGRAPGSTAVSIRPPPTNERLVRTRVGDVPHPRFDLMKRC